MTLPSSGTIAASDILTELGRGGPLVLAPTTDTDVLTLIGKTQGSTINVPGDFYGKALVQDNIQNAAVFTHVYAMRNDGSGLSNLNNLKTDHGSEHNGTTAGLTYSDVVSGGTEILWFTIDLGADKHIVEYEIRNAGLEGSPTFVFRCPCEFVIYGVTNAGASTLLSVSSGTFDGETAFTGVITVNASYRYLYFYCIALTSTDSVTGQGRGAVPFRYDGWFYMDSIRIKGTP